MAVRLEGQLGVAGRVDGLARLFENEGVVLVGVISELQPAAPRQDGVLDDDPGHEGVDGLPAFPKDLRPSCRLDQELNVGQDEPVGVGDRLVTPLDRPTVPVKVFVAANPSRFYHSEFTTT